MKVDQATNIKLVKQALERKARILRMENDIAAKKAELSNLHELYDRAWDFAYESIYSMDAETLNEVLARVYGIENMRKLEKEISVLSNQLMQVKQCFTADMIALTRVQLREDQEHDKREEAEAGEEGNA